ncbi:glycerol transport system permease protein [Desulfobaculum xiamenense]|uniref:Glycerol transport system permease protein n=1 Tax=Desulfobaculum xiamenense TaxID=995050 RepID=A0A846QMZ2_9BACT|nr:sugar ABC transporter permease [Desulfobaculum xiamenense]NJB68557.1 glycerol transport system permease protein [Desulfobaculum xiamenense]
MKNRAWFFLIPALVLMSISAFVPLMTVINYSLHYIFSGSAPTFVGFENYVEVLRDPTFWGALTRQLCFSLMVLLVEIPLGIMIAMAMPRQGAALAVCLVMLGIPLLIPYNVVGIIWRLFTQASIGVVPGFFRLFDYSYSVALNPVDAPVTIFVLDVWHWTPLVALLSFAGLQAIPDAYYQAAQIDGASTWKTFRYVTLPKLKPVLILAVLLRFMDSFKIYAEPLLLTGGGPGNSTTFFSLHVARKAESYELGYAGAVSIIYLFIVIMFSFVFFQAMTNIGKGEQQ